MTSQAHGPNRWFVVLGAVLMQLSLGAIYAWSVFTPSLIAAGWSRMETQIVFAVGLATFALVMVFAGRLLTRYGPQRLAVAGGLVLGAGYLLTGLVGATSFPVVVLGIGVIGGAGIGLGYVCRSPWGCAGFPTARA